MLNKLRAAARGATPHASACAHARSGAARHGARSRRSKESALRPSHAPALKVSMHNTPNDCWVSFLGGVYDLSGVLKARGAGVLACCPVWVRVRACGCLVAALAAALQRHCSPLPAPNKQPNAGKPRARGGAHDCGSWH
jgi:hypothetical protein